MSLKCTTSYINSTWYVDAVCTSRWYSVSLEPRHSDYCLDRQTDRQVRHPPDQNVVVSYPVFSLPPTVSRSLSSVSNKNILDLTFPSVHRLWRWHDNTTKLLYSNIPGPSGGRVGPFLADVYQEIRPRDKRSESMSAEFPCCNFLSSFGSKVYLTYLIRSIDNIDINCRKFLRRQGLVAVTHEEKYCQISTSAGTCVYPIQQWYIHIMYCSTVW